MKKRREIAAILAAVLLFLCLGFGAGALLRPVRTQFGCMWPAYLREERNSLDVLYFGSSMVYCDVAPAWVWAESGLRGFVMAAPEQTMPITYYYVREACRTQSPRIILLEATGMFFSEYQNYTKPNISYMPFGWNRLAAMTAAAEPSLWDGLLFPLLHYHDRWTDVSADELRANLAPAADPLAGFTLLEDACAAPTPYEREELTADSDTYRENLRWLERIRDFCAGRGIGLQLYIAPSASRIPASAMETLRADAAARGIELLDCNARLPEMGIDDDADWYDYLHFNAFGAEKFSRWLGRYLADETGNAGGGRGDALWAERLRTLDDRMGRAEA